MANQFSPAHQGLLQQQTTLIQCAQVSDTTPDSRRVSRITPALIAAPRPRTGAEQTNHYCRTDT